MEASPSMRAGASSIAFQQIQKGELQFVAEIGSGGFGTVYKAKHRHLGCVAVKKCRLNSQTEVDGLAKPGLNSAIVQIYGWIQPTRADGNSYIVMEYMKYGSLKDFSRKLNPFPNSLKIRMISEVINCMDFLHSRNIIHRDLKLENIFVGKEFSVKIGDLGLATWESVEDATKGGAGTVTHIAPERFENVHQIATKMSDVYSFGITLWELSTGEEPFKNAQNGAHIIACVLKGQKPNMKCFPQDEPPIIKDMMERAWNQTPTKRPTFQELKEEIENKYAANYRKDINCDLSIVYGQMKEEECCEGTCTAPWSKDTPDSSPRLLEDTVSRHEGSTPGPLRSSGHSIMESNPDKKPVTVEDKEAGNLAGVSTIMEKLDLGRQPQDVGGKAVQPESDTFKEPSQSGQAPSVTTDEFEPRIPTQESQHKNPETSSHSSFQNQPYYSQQQTEHNPYQSFMPQGLLRQGIHNPYQSFMPQGLLRQGININVSGDGHTVIVAETGSTVTTQNKEKKRKKLAERQESPSSFDSESDVLDPEVQEIMHSREILKEKHIGKLSRHIGREWKELGRSLGMEDVEMQNVEYDHQFGGQQEFAFQVMLKWMRKKGKATKGQLATALVDVGLANVVPKLK